MYVRLDGREVRGRQAAHLRAAALLRGAAARPRLHRGARHHRAHLRDLPGRLPDELGAGDGGRVRRAHRRGPAARPAPADLLRRVDREPQPARLHAARARLPRLRGRGGDGPRPPRDRRTGPADEEGGQRADGARRGPRGAPDQRARRRLLPGSTARASCARCVEPLERARETALATVRVGRRSCRFPDVERAPELRRAVGPGRRVPDRPRRDRAPTGGLDIAPARVRRAHRRGARRALQRAARPHARAAAPT